jgi:hypothetical protein
MASSSSPCRQDRASALAITALALFVGAMALTTPANAQEPNPLLGNVAGITALNSQEMDAVQGTGYWANYYGSLGLDNLEFSRNAGYYARYLAFANSSSEYANYASARDYAGSASTYFDWASFYSLTGQ